MRFSFICSPDSALVLKEARGLAKKFFEKIALPEQMHVYWGDEGLTSEFWQTLTISSLDARADFIIVRTAEKLDSETWKRISETLGTLREEVFIVFCLEVDWEKGKPKIPAIISNQMCFTFSEKKGWNFRLAPLTAESLPKYIRKAMAERKLQASNEILEMLSTMLPPFASAVDNTFDQLLLGVENATITKEDLANISMNSEGLMVFEFIKNLENNKPFDLWRELLLDAGSAKDVYFALVANLTTQARQMWQILFNDDVVGIHPYVLQLRTQMARKMGQKRVGYLFLLLREAELSIKSGKKDIVQAMEELLYDLSILYKV